MPANAITELFRNLKLNLGQAEPPPAGAAETMRLHEKPPGRDFAGMLAENLRARPQSELKTQPNPAAEPAQENAPASEEPGKEPAQAADKPQAENPPAETTEPTAASEPAAEPGEQTSATNQQPTEQGTPTANQKSSAEQPTTNPFIRSGQGPPLKPWLIQTQPQGVVSAPAKAGPAATQSGPSTTLAAPPSTNSSFSTNDMNVVRPVRIDGGSQGGQQTDGQTEATAQQKVNTPSIFNALKTVLNGGADGKAPPAEAAAATAKTSTEGPPATVLQATERNAGQAPPAANNRATVFATATEQIASDAPTPPATPASQTSKPANPVPQATVIPEQGSAKPLAPGDGTDTAQNQSASNDNTLALHLARLLLNVKVTAGGNDPAPLAGQDGQQAQGADGPAAHGSKVPAPQGQAVVMPSPGSSEGRGSSSQGVFSSESATGTTAHRAGQAESEPSALEQVVRAARAQIGARHSQVRLQLQPPDLGRLRIDVRIDGKTLQMHMEAQTELAHRLLTSRVAELRGTLQAQGLNVERVQIDLRGPQQTSSPNQQGQSEIDHPMRDTHPDAQRGGQRPTEEQSDPEQGTSDAERLLGEADEEETQNETVSLSGVNLMA